MVGDWIKVGFYIFYKNRFFNNMLILEKNALYAQKQLGNEEIMTNKK